MTITFSAKYYLGTNISVNYYSYCWVTQGLSTYDYIIAMREQEQEQLGNGGQQSPQMSTVSSFTGLSSASSFTTLHRGAWCTPPRLLLEDQVTYFQFKIALYINVLCFCILCLEFCLLKIPVGIVPFLQKWWCWFELLA